VKGVACAQGPGSDRLAALPAPPQLCRWSTSTTDSSPEARYDLEVRYWPWAESAALIELPRVSLPGLRGDGLELWLGKRLVPFSPHQA